MNPLKSIAIVSNLSKAGVRAVSHSLEKICRDNQVEVRLTEEFPCPQNFLKGMDACFSVGGDGTLLNLLDQAIAHEVPVAGVGVGKLGFLSTLD
ncbi:MAG: NAD(+)/NADH kinase, partial [Opitutae bacterium]